MNTSELKKFAQWARRTLIDQIGARVSVVLDAGSAERREFPAAVKSLENEIASSSQAQVIDRAAYIWFNRFTALRYMDAGGLTLVRAVSPNEGQSRPALLADAMAGQINETVPTKTRERVLALLGRSAPSREPEAEAYRLLLVAECNGWHKAMPYLFEAIADWTELLMPVDLLSGESILARMQDVMTESDCQDVEIIGWLYQFYISEKKDEVFAGLKKNQKITAENIPAATQLFTPHWIVRYLVENSLGRLWLLNRPGSKLAERMDYYIAPEEPETDFLKIGKPEEFKVCDPACGSGHMLTYAFDLLYAIYEEEGYDPQEIPALILAHNLTGVEIDDRAGALAAFALAMKAAAKLGRRQFLRMESKPDVVVLQNVTFTPAEMQDVAAVVGKDLFTDELRETLGQFDQAKNFGSLIIPDLRDPTETLRVVEARNLGGDLLLNEVQWRVVTVLRMAEALSSKYHTVVANPPYMNGKGMNGQLAKFLQSKYEAAKSDLFAAFMLRNHQLCVSNGVFGFMTPFTWLFLSSHQKLREWLLTDVRLTSLIRPEYHAFFDSAYVPLCVFCLTKTPAKNSNASFIDLQKFYGADQQPLKALEAIALREACSWYHVRALESFSALPGSPVAFWLNEKLLEAFSDTSLGERFEIGSGLSTSDNDRFVRYLWEPSLQHICRDITSVAESKFRDEKWFLFQKGGAFRRWHGNLSHVVNWKGDGAEIKNWVTNNPKDPGTTHWSRRIFNTNLYFREGITWSTISSGDISFRFSEEGSMISNAAGGIFGGSALERTIAIAGLNSKIWSQIFGVLNPTLNFSAGIIQKAPMPRSGVIQGTQTLIELSKSDWDAFETSWDFTMLPLLSLEQRADTIEATYARLRAHWQGMTDEMQQLEEENNRIFIDAYGLQDELAPEVPIEEITLTCNPAYRYGVKGSEEDRETRLRSDTIAEFLSYAVGCMFGRYSLDAPRLILANQGETLADYLARVPEPTFLPDEDNVIPVLDGDWFADDITERFRKFLRVTFGEERFQENLAFIEASLGKKLQAYFLRDFYADHVKRYKKRPIYWLFSSPGGSFNALIYMHRYRPDTVSIVLNKYLRGYREKLEAARREQERLEISGEASAGEKTQAIKEKERLKKILRELDAYERDILFPLAEQKIEIDLDDGVKANYPRFGPALAQIKGMGEE